MSELSDYQRMVEKPHLAALNATIAELRSALATARQDEREACARMADDRATFRRVGKYPDMNLARECKSIAAAIRARKEP